MLKKLNIFQSTTKSLVKFMFRDNMFYGVGFHQQLEHFLEVYQQMRSDTLGPSLQLEY